MKAKTNLFIQKLITYLGLNNEKTAVEVLQNFIKEQQHRTLLSRIDDIRNHSNYVPNYNLPKVFTDVEILYNVNPESSHKEYKPINSNIRLAQKRPVDFGNDMQKWMDAVFGENKDTLDNENSRREAYEKVMQERYDNVNKFYNKMLRVN